MLDTYCPICNIFFTNLEELHKHALTHKPITIKRPYESEKEEKTRQETEDKRWFK